MQLFVSHTFIKEKLFTVSTLFSLTQSNKSQMYRKRLLWTGPYKSNSCLNYVWNHTFFKCGKLTYDANTQTSRALSVQSNSPNFPRQNIRRFCDKLTKLINYKIIPLVTVCATQHEFSATRISHRLHKFYLVLHLVLFTFTLQYIVWCMGEEYVKVYKFYNFSATINLLGCNMSMTKILIDCTIFK